MHAKLPEELFKYLAFSCIFYAVLFDARDHVLAAEVMKVYEYFMPCDVDLQVD